VKKSIEKTVRVLEALGYEVEEYDLKFDFAKMWSNYCDVVAVHTAALFDSMAPVVGHAVSEKEVSPTIWSMLQKANEIGSVKHAEDVDGVRLASVEIAEELHALDIFICPVMTNPPRKLGHWNMNEPDIDHYNENMMWDCAFTAPFNVSGQPAISVPMHWTDDGLPVGVQLVGRHGDEALLFQLAAQLELQEKWHQRAPKLLSM
jgi:amidase